MKKQLMGKCGAVNIVNQLAKGMAASSVNSTCLWAHHQPKVPEEALKLKKF